MDLTELNSLKEDEKLELLRAPAYIVMLVTNASGGPNELGKRTGLNFSALNAFTSDVKLKPYFEAANKNLQGDLLSLKFKFPEGKEKREQKLKEKLKDMEPLFKTLPSSFAGVLIDGLNAFAQHIGGNSGQIIDFKLE